MRWYTPYCYKPQRSEVRDRPCSPCLVSNFTMVSFLSDFSKLLPDIFKLSTSQGTLHPYTRNHLHLGKPCVCVSRLKTLPSKLKKELFSRYSSIYLSAFSNKNKAVVQMAEACGVLDKVALCPVPKPWEFTAAKDSHSLRPLHHPWQP